MSLYKILDISPTSTLDEIKKAYHKQILKFHPDKNPNPDARERFEEVTMAYNILKDEKSRTEYAKLDSEKENHFWLLLQGWIRKISTGDLGILFENKNYDNLNFLLSQMENFSLTQILSWFNQPQNIPTNNTYLDSITHSESWNDENGIYLDELPLKFLEENELDIKLILKININDILENKLRKIKINRKVNNKNITSNFTISCLKPYIVFSNGGDWGNKKKGDLIISLEIEDWNWCYDGIYLEKNISVYQMIYGVNLEILLGKETLTIRDWIPHRDGWKLFLDKDLPIKCYLKLILNYQDTEQKKEILYNYFS
jgi:DnaJ-class molecular chaperone